MKLCQTSTVQKYLEIDVRETKSRSGSDPWSVRTFAPKMFAVRKCPVKAYKGLRRKATSENENDVAPFYLAVNNLKYGSGKD